MRVIGDSFNTQAMLDQYTRAEMQAIWTEQATYQKWLEVEFAVCEAYRQIGRAPRSLVKEIKAKANFKLERIHELENQGRQDVLAFLSSVGESLSSEEQKYFHLGISSSDLKDTALSLIIKEAAALLDRDMDELMDALRELALAYKNTACIGRVHGVYAEPTSFGLKMLSYYDDISRLRQHLKYLVTEVCVGMFSGSTGSFVNLGTEIEKLASENLGIKPALISTQIIGRDRLAMFINQVAIIASVLERLAIEIRNLQRPELAEVEEPFLVRMGTNNLMPHKRSPWRCENISGLARMIRSYTNVSLDNIMVWHERDSSHNAAERIILPDACILLDFILNRMTLTIKGLVVYPKRMYQNLFKAGGVVFAQQLILVLIDKGMDRQMATEIIQGFAHEAWNDLDGNFKALVFASEQIREYLNEDELNTCFKPEIYLKNIDQIYAAVFGDAEDTRAEVPSFV